VTIELKKIEGAQHRVTDRSLAGHRTVGGAEGLRRQLPNRRRASAGPPVHLGRDVMIRREGGGARARRRWNEAIYKIVKDFLRVS
jgi:hypothetical protein